MINIEATKEDFKMAKDFVTGRRTHFGNTRSHALNHSRRSWKPNLHKVRILVDGKPKRAVSYTHLTLPTICSV